LKFFFKKVARLSRLLWEQEVYTTCHPTINFHLSFKMEA
jgi:hypothetical protein